MSFCIKTFLMFLISFFAYAESATPPAPKSDVETQIYTKESAANVEALNHATEVLRDPVKALKPNHEEKAPPETQPPLHDPTQMSSNFRQALKGWGNPANPNNAAQLPKIPLIELAAKMLGKNKSVMLKINERVVQMVENGKTVFVDKETQQVIRLEVKKIDASQVKIFVEPLNQTLILQ